LPANADKSGMYTEPKVSVNIVEGWIHGLTQMCKTPVFIPASTSVNRPLLRTCRSCGSSVDCNCEDCPICGDSKSDNFSLIPHLRFHGICSECQTCCYEPYCPVCGDKIDQGKESRFSCDREPMTWTVTALRVRTPTGVAGSFLIENLCSNDCRHTGSKEILVPMLCRSDLNETRK
jgi:hypothetical protein